MIEDQLRRVTLPRNPTLTALLREAADELQRLRALAKVEQERVVFAQRERDSLRLRFGELETMYDAVLVPQPAPPDAD